MRAVWQVVDLMGWRSRVERAGLVFDCPSVWSKVYPDLSDDLKKHLQELNGDEKDQRWKTFRCLKLWSFTPIERIRLAEEIPRTACF